jgi:hypothetical protein
MQAERDKLSVHRPGFILDVNDASKAPRLKFRERNPGPSWNIARGRRDRIAVRIKRRGPHARRKRISFLRRQVLCSRRVVPSVSQTDIAR